MNCRQGPNTEERTAARLTLVHNDNNNHDDDGRDIASSSLRGSVLGDGVAMTDDHVTRDGSDRRRSAGGRG